MTCIFHRLRHRAECVCPLLEPEVSHPQPQLHTREVETVGKPCIQAQGKCQCFERKLTPYLLGTTVGIRIQ